MNKDNPGGHAASTPFIETAPNLDLNKLCEIVGTQLEAQMERLGVESGSSKPGFAVMIWGVDVTKVSFITNRSNREMAAAMLNVSQHLQAVARAGQPDLGGVKIILPPGHG